MLATQADNEGYAFPSYTCLAKDTGMTIRSVRRALKEIPADELVIAQQGKSHRAALYRVIITGSLPSVVPSVAEPRAEPAKLTPVVTDSHGQSNTNSLCAPIAHKDTQDESLCAPNAHEGVNQKFAENLCAHNGTSLCANEQPLCAHMDPLCAPNAHRTVLEQPKEEQLENTHARAREAQQKAEVQINVSNETKLYSVDEKQDGEEPKQSFAEPRKPPPTEEEKRERLISDLDAEFPQINVRSIADRYLAELDGKPWDNKQFKRRVGKAQHLFWRESRTQ
jgi:hypothetical protein